MRDLKPILLLASAAALTLALHQGAQAEPIKVEPPATGLPLAAPVVPSEPAAAKVTDTTAAPAPETGASAAPSQPASAETAPSPTPAQEVAVPSADSSTGGSGASQPPAAKPIEQSSATPQPPVRSPEGTAARKRMEQRRAEMAEERNRRYQDLRARAAEVGLELPETPPWEQEGMQPPGMPTPPLVPTMTMPKMPGHRLGAMTPEERDAQREQRYELMRERASQRGVELPETPPWMLMSEEERQAQREKIRNMGPEARRAMREKHWQEMRERAVERGIDMPEMPPWKQGEQRREEMKARWESYKETLDTMTPEQEEAVEAIYGQGQRRFSPPATRRQIPQRMPMQVPFGPQGFGITPNPGMPGFGGQGADPSMYSRGPWDSWTGGEQPMRPWPAPQWPGTDSGNFQVPPPPGGDYNQPWQ